MPKKVNPHIFFMRKALRLAKKAQGMTSPNPIVGCVIVKNNKIIGEGYHLKAGLPHAEINAMNNARGSLKGAVMYVTLEPCSHFGRTPPCADAVAKSGIKAVYAAMKDPNPLTNGKGLELLKKNGIRVVTGVMEKDAKEMNRPFIKFIKTGMPYVTLKLAQSLDGKIASYTGDSKWISGEKSRQYVQKLRSVCDAVMVGINTVIKDDPLLLPKIKTKRLPARIVVDSGLRIPLNCRIVRSSARAKVYIAATENANKKKAIVLKNKGVELMRTKASNGKVDLGDLLKQAASKGIVNILVEGGSELAGSLCDKGFVDEFIIFVSPVIVGGKKALTAIGGMGSGKINEALKLSDVAYKLSGNDIMIRGYKE